MYQVLLVDDEPVILRNISKVIDWEKFGFSVCATAECGEEACRLLKEHKPSLVITDVMMPQMDGFTICSQLRSFSKGPIIFVTSRNTDMDELCSMQMGGDDFIAKPFDLDVLTAKVQAMLRRTYEFAGQSRLLEHRGAVLNVDDATLTIAGNKLPLTRNEQRILQTLLENKGRIVSRDHLMLRLWESDSYVDDNTLTVNITRLRKKLEQAGLPGFILTKKGSGYLID